MHRGGVTRLHIVIFPAESIEGDLLQHFQQYEPTRASLMLLEGSYTGEFSVESRAIPLLTSKLEGLITRTSAVTVATPGRHWSA